MSAVKRRKQKLGAGDRAFNIVLGGLTAVSVVVILYPLIFVLVASISDPMEIFQGNVWLWPKGFTLEAYKQVFRNRVLEQDTQAFAWQCETVRNKSTLHPQTDAVVAEIEGGPDTVVNVTVNGRTHTASIAQLLDGGVTWHVKPWHSEAVKIHAAVPDSAYEMVLEAEDEGSGGMDVYHAEFAQKNGQWAFVSPIYAGL